MDVKIKIDFTDGNMAKTAKALNGNKKLKTASDLVKIFFILLCVKKISRNRITPTNAAKYKLRSPKLIPKKLKLIKSGLIMLGYKSSNLLLIPPKNT